MDKIATVQINFTNGTYTNYNFNNLPYKDKVSQMFAINRYLHLSLEEHKGVNQKNTYQTISKCCGECQFIAPHWEFAGHSCGNKESEMYGKDISQHGLCGDFKGVKP